MKTTWTWIVVGLVVLGLLLVRERFTTYEEALKDVGQSAGYIVPKCPDGYTMSVDQKDCTKPKSDGSLDHADPTCPDGSRFVKEGIQGHCESATTPAPASPSSGPTGGTPPPGSAGIGATSGPIGGTPPPGSAGIGATSGTTTGGASGSTYGPNSGGRGSGPNIWGPLFPGFGTKAGPVNGDSTKTNAYPVLLGGMQGRQSTRLEGVGIVPPSGGAGGWGIALPSPGTMGSDSKSMYLPFSRQPGDMDLIPDPYRLAKNFSTSSYTASKTDPVPFLTDFSSFYK